MNVWFVKPEDVRIELVYNAANGTSHPLWIVVKKFLTVGEQRRVMTAGWRGMRSSVQGSDGAPTGNEIQIDWRAQTFARTEAYLLRWSLTDGQPSREVIESLDADVYSVIEEAINQHVAAVAEEKKLSAGTPSP